MSEFMIDFDQMQNSANRISSMQDAISACQRQLGEIAISAVLRDGMPLLVPNIAAMELSLAGHKSKLDGLSTALNRIVIRFKLAEQNISGEQLVSFSDFIDYIFGGGGSGDGSGAGGSSGLSLSEIWSWVTGACPAGNIFDMFAGLFTGATTGDFSGTIAGFLSLFGELAENAFADDPAGTLELLFGLGVDDLVQAGVLAFENGESILATTWSQAWDDILITGGHNLGQNIKAGCTWLASLAVNAFDNYAEFGTIQDAHFWEELVTETAVDVGMGAATTALVAAGAAALGISAPAVAIGAVAAGVCWGANELVEYFTGQDIGEWASDGVTWVCDTVVEGATWAWDQITDIGESIGDAVSDGWNSFVDWAFG